MLHAQVEQQDAAERAGASAVQSGAEASPPPASPFGYGDASCGAFSHPLSGQLPSGGASSAAAIMDSVIILAACAGGETLPTSPELPADLFTSCLTTPIPMVRAHGGRRGARERTRRGGGVWFVRWPRPR